MPSPCFHFKQFTVCHDRCAMKVNTDAVLLGAWTPVGNPASILDIGTGSGILALMLAQRATQATVHGVEIEPEAFEQASENCRNSPWAPRMQIVHADFRKYQREHPKYYELVVCNPPFFSQSLRNPGVKKQMARHNDLLSAGDLIGGVKKVLHPEGMFAVIVPYENAEIEAEACIQGLNTIGTLAIKSAPGKPFIRKILLLAFRQVQLKVREELIIHSENGSYSEQYKQLTADFYLHFPKK